LDRRLAELGDPDVDHPMSAAPKLLAIPTPPATLAGGRSASVLSLILALTACSLPNIHGQVTSTETGDTTAPPVDTGPFGCGDPGILCTGVGTGERGANGDQPANEVWLDLPTSVGATIDGDLLFADFNNLKIRELGADGTVATISGSGFHANAGEGPALDSPMENPIDAVQCDASGVYIAELHAARVVFVSSDEMLTFAAGMGGFEGYTGDGGPATKAMLSELSGVACGPQGELYIADTVNNVIRVLNKDATIDTFAGNGTPGLVDGSGDTAQFFRPEHMEVFDGGLYVADWLNHAIRRVDLTTREVTTVAGNGTPGFSGDGGPATAAQLRGPNGLGFAPDGTMYIADSDNDVIRAVDPQGTISTVAGQAPGPDLDGDGLPMPHPGYTGDLGACLDAQLNWPNDVAVLPDGKVWVADTMNSVLRYFVPPGPQQ
jgi:hypothetical protein